MRHSTFKVELLPRMVEHCNDALRILPVVFLAACVLGAAVPSVAAERLQALARSITFEWAKSHPLSATFLGLSDHDGELDTPSQAQNARDLELIHGWQKELASIPLDGASLIEVDDAKLLRAQLVALERQYLVYKNYEKDPSGPSLGVMGAIYTQFLHLPIAGVEGATKTDVDVAWRKIIRRLEGAPAYIAAGNALVIHQATFTASPEPTSLAARPVSSRVR